MESARKWFVYFFSKTNRKVLCIEIDTPNKKQSLFKRYIRFFSKRILVMFAFFHLMLYKNLVSFSGHIAGKYLAKHQIVPYHIYKLSEKKEDPGVTEMRALLRGEDCFDYNLEQSQLRTSLPGDINPYEELYLVSFHCRYVAVIICLLDSLKKHDEPFAQSFNSLFSWFDKFVVGYFDSIVAINQRD